MIPRPPRSTRLTHSLPTRRSSDLKRGVEYQIIGVDSEGASERQLQVLVELGVRISSDAPDGVDAPIHVQIEAEFVVVYEVLDDIDETSIPQFANFNAVHNVWPFWRQHVFDIVQRARLPQIERSEEHTSELQSLMRFSYAVFCLKKKKQKYSNNN